MSILNWFYKTKQPINTQEVNPDIFTPTKEDDKKLSNYWTSTAKFIKQNAEDELKNRVKQQEYEQLKDEQVKNYLLEQSNKVKTFLEGYDTVTYSEMNCDVCEVFKDVNKIPEFLEAFGKDFDYAYNVCYDSQAVIMYAKLKHKFHLTFEERYGKPSETDILTSSPDTSQKQTYYQNELYIANENARQRMINEKRQEEIEEQIREELTNYWITPYKENTEYDVVVSFASFDEMKSFMDTFGKDFYFSYKINIEKNTFIDIYALKENIQ